jgi:hypothetical protein
MQTEQEPLVDPPNAGFGMLQKDYPEGEKFGISQWKPLVKTNQEGKTLQPFVYTTCHRVF